MGYIELNEVTKNFGDLQVIKPLNLNIKDGEFTVFVGPSGCGKSTLLRLIAGLEDLTSGSIKLFDSNIEDLGAAFVGSENYSFITQTVEYLNSTGKSPYFFEMRNPANPNANKRRNAYLKIMKKLKLNPEIIKIEGKGWNFEEIAKNGALKLLRQNSIHSDTYCLYENNNCNCSIKMRKNYISKSFNRICTIHLSGLYLITIKRLYSCKNN